MTIEKILENDPKYRISQAEKALYNDLISDWDECTNLPLGIREALKKEFPLNIKATIKESSKKDSAKALIFYNDQQKVETVLMRHKDRNTICLSTQVGCALGCKFCATGKYGFERNLSEKEIIDQALFWGRYLKKKKQKINNAVFMGMGEPFLNYSNFINSVHILNEKMGIGARHISVSTVGIIEGIRKLSEESMQINLALSLHASDNETRSSLMPVNRKYPIEDILSAVKDYIKKTHRKVMIEYNLIEGVNDSESDAEHLVKILPRLCMVNLIACNSSCGFKPPSKEVIKKFKSVLVSNKVEVTERYRFGRNIEGACGQLACRF